MSTMKVAGKVASVYWLLIIVLALAEPHQVYATESLCSVTVDDAGLSISNLKTGFLGDESVWDGACAIQGRIDGRIGMDLRLPSKGWNGKLLFQGCRAYCGVLMIEDAADAFARGYAVVTTDMGHEGSVLDASWGLDDLRAEIDFAYHATHATAVAAKLLTTAHYGEAPTQSYFRGCSTGGRQGFMAAQRFPADFDGIIAGAPVVPGTGTLNLLWMSLANLDPDGEILLDKAALGLLREEALSRCDAVDGVMDGIIEDPRVCAFDAQDLICSADTTTECLTQDQANAAAAIYAGPIGAHGPLSLGGPAPGSEANWAGGIIGADGVPGLYFQVAEDNLRYLSFVNDPDPDYDAWTFDFTKDPAKLGHGVQLQDPYSGNFEAYERRGGKMIAYHGWQDESVVPWGTAAFQERLSDALGDDEANSFFRLFMVPGMNHCGGGPGPDEIDWLRALESWVEDGEAPDLLAEGPRAKTPTAYKPKLRPFPLAPAE